MVGEPSQSLSFYTRRFRLRHACPPRLPPRARGEREQSASESEAEAPEGESAFSTRLRMLRLHCASHAQSSRRRLHAHISEMPPAR